MDKTRMRVLTHALIIALLTLLTVPAFSDEVAEAQKIVDDAKKTFENFVADPNMGWFHTHIKNTKGVFIVPQLLKAGFIFGGSGGSGVMLGRDEKTDRWSNPVHHGLGDLWSTDRW